MNIDKIYKIFNNSVGISTDTRTIKKGQIFLALEGENFDGHNFINDAFNSGASHCVVHKKVKVDNIHIDKIIKVKNTRKTLKDLARRHRLKFDIPVIVVGGSNGKTTTKDLIYSVLSQKYNVLCSKKSFNNDLGVSFTLLDINKKNEIVLLEVGTNHFGEIKELLDICRPTYGLITNIGKEHLEGFKNIKGVIKEEGSIFDYLVKNKGVIFCNNNLPNVLINKSKKTESYFYDVKNVVIKKLLPIEFLLKNENLKIKSSLIGKWNIENILASIVLGLHFNISKNAIYKGVKEYEAKNLRSEFRKFKNINLLLDCYNSNPSSMTELLSFFENRDNKNTFFIVGGMLELGKDSKKEHLKIVKSIIDLDFKKVFFIGKEFSDSQKILESNYYFENTNTAKEFIANFNFPKNSLVAIKGSRGYALEKIFNI